MFQLRYFIVICVFTPSYFVYSQVVNLALNKHAKSNVPDYKPPSLVVDGDLSQEYSKCGSTIFMPKQTVAWWQVDLESIAEIINITIYYRESKGTFIAVRRLNGFQITFRMDTIWNTEAACYRDNDSVYPLDITTIDICTGPGRYVTIFNYHFDNADEAYGPLLELCEVQVFGCTLNKYGTECTFDCHCKQKGCYRRDGICFTPGCEAGWEGTSCNKICGDNTFGFGCASRCNCLQGTCNHITGICYKEGCQAGSKALICSTPCDANNNEFGRDCNFTCHCLEGTCNSITGVCNKKGCLEGWQGPTCSTPCKTDNFGRDCKFTCYCLTGSCPRTTGICTDKRCKPGWLTETCSQPCKNNTFGENCKTTCHCNQHACNNSNGQCLIKGCKAGWKGNSCSTQCTGNEFGKDCKKTCHCLNGTCNPMSGSCYIAGCEPGYLGDACTKRCDNSFYGINCSLKCFCKEGTCNLISGECNDNMCKDGWKGDTCSESCKDGWKGSTCSEDLDLNSKTLPVILGVLVGSLGFILVAMLKLIYIFRRKRSAESTKDVDVSQPKLEDALDHVYHELGLSESTEYAVIQTDDNRETTYINDSCDNTILRIDKIRDEVTVKIQNGTLQEQHKNIPLGPLHPQTAGRLLKNKKKNRNQNILPYDHSRVILDTSNQDQDADYINASYINGLIKDSTYIATQGPMKNTVEDFWRMIWQTKSSVIVMLTNDIEQNQVTCFQYWPVSSNVLGIPGYEITLLKEQMRSEFIIRKLKVKNIKTGEVRKMCLLQFTSWPKRSVPHPYQLYLLHQKYAEIIFTNNSGPAIIHCGDGSDRTGVFIAFDAISHCCYRNETIDICQLVTDMRINRMNMVATEECYIFLHKLFLEYLLFQDTNIPKHDFRTAIKEEDNNIDREYEVG